MTSESAGNIEVYFDFNCPFCYTLSRNIAQSDLGADFVWCGIELAPGHSVPMTPLDQRLDGLIDEEIVRIRDLDPTMEIRKPSGRPNTRLAHRLVQGAALTDAAAATRLRSALYDAYWQQSQDLSNTEVLQQHAAACKVDYARAVTAVADEDIEFQTRKWKMLGGRVPFMRRDDGAVIFGAAGISRIREFIASGDKSILAAWDQICAYK